MVERKPLDEEEGEAVVVVAGEDDDPSDSPILLLIEGAVWEPKSRDDRLLSASS